MAEAIDRATNEVWKSGSLPWDEQHEREASLARARAAIAYGNKGESTAGEAGIDDKKLAANRRKIAKRRAARNA